MGFGVTCDLAILSDFLNIEDMYNWYLEWQGPIFATSWEPLPAKMKATQREKQSQNYVNQYFFLVFLFAIFSRVTDIYNQKNAS